MSKAKSNAEESSAFDVGLTAGARCPVGRPTPEEARTHIELTSTTSSDGAKTDRTKTHDGEPPVAYWTDANVGSTEYWTDANVGG